MAAHLVCAEAGPGCFVSGGYLRDARAWLVPLFYWIWCGLGGWPAEVAFRRRSCSLAFSPVAVTLVAVVGWGEVINIVGLVRGLLVPVRAPRGRGGQ